MARGGWRIWHPNGTYFAGWAAIGPKFGAERKDAARFDSARDAFAETTRHSFAFVGCLVESPIGKRYDDPPLTRRSR